jgi:hypothetical protein
MTTQKAEREITRKLKAERKQQRKLEKRKAQHAQQASKVRP